MGEYDYSYSLPVDFENLAEMVIDSLVENLPAALLPVLPEQFLPLDDRMFLGYPEPLPPLPCPRKSPGLNLSVVLAGAG